MKQWVDVIGIALGSLVMAWAIGRAWAMRYAVQQAGYCALLRTLIALMLLFLGGYLFSIWALLTRHAEWLHSIVSFVFLFGSVFVLLTVWLAQNTSTKLRQYTQHLEALVEERTLHLQQAIREQERSRRYFAQLFEGLPVACFTYDREGVIRDWNAEAERLYGFSKAEAIGKTIYELFCRPEDVEATQRVIEQVFAGEVFRHLEWQDIAKDGSIRWMLCSTFPLTDADGQVVGAISANMDITERKRQQQLIEEQRDELEAQNETLQQVTARLAEVNAKLQHLARTDALTGLPNHRVFRERLQREFLWALERDRPLSILLVDVDHFKHFNDTFGHQAGDEVLRKVASVLASCCPEPLFAARYGGEEFVALLPDTPASEATQFAETLRQHIAEMPCCYCQITASFGVSTVDTDTLNPDTLIEEADRALYVSKREGRNRVTHAFEAGVRVLHIDPAEWQERLSQARTDPNGYAAQQVISQIVYDYLQLIRLLNIATLPEQRETLLQQVSQRLARSQALKTPLADSEPAEFLFRLLGEFQALLHTYLQNPSSQTLAQLHHIGTQLVQMLQETSTPFLCAA